MTTKCNISSEQISVLKEKNAINDIIGSTNKIEL